MEYAPVDRSKKEAQAWYDRLAGWYDRLIYPFERAAIARCLEVASVSSGEAVLEIGTGTGNTLVRLAADAGDAGRVVGIDLSSKMVEQTQAKLGAHGVSRASVQQGDATDLPFVDGSFDVVVMTFTLELFPEDQLLTVLDETDRVLNDGGRFVVLSLYREGRMAKLYERLHNRFPTYLDCRPLPLDELLNAREWTVHDTKHGTMGGVPYVVIDARPPSPPAVG